MSSTAKKDDRLSIVRRMEWPDAFKREDETDDTEFYKKDRFVQHLDVTALQTVEKVVGELVVEKEPKVLDLMASFDSHIPDSVTPYHVAAIGMNENELSKNPKLDEYRIHDLNKEPELPFDDDEFDVVLNTVSVDYLVSPFQVFEEVNRVLKPGGIHLVIFSSRYFPKKVVRVWADAGEEERVDIVREYFERAGGYTEPHVFVSMGKPRPEGDKYSVLGVPSDPIYAVYAEKEGDRGDRPERPVLTDDLPELISKDEFKKRKAAIKDTHQCPYCGTKLSKWKVPDDPFIEWNSEYMYICFNDNCPYTVRGWKAMQKQGNSGVTYRLMYIPETDSTHPVPVHSLSALREGIEEE